MDASGQDIDTHHPSLVKIPVDKDKEVEQVLFFPEGQAPQSLAFERVGDVVIFTAPHFTHYAIVYKPAQTEEPDQPIQPEEPAKPDQPVQPAQPNQPVQPATPVTPDPANPLKPTEPSQVDQLAPTTSTQAGHQEEEHKDMVDQEIHQLLSAHQGANSQPTVQQENKRCQQRKSIGTLAKYGKPRTSFAAEAVLLAALGGFLLAGKKKEE